MGKGFGTARQRRDRSLSNLSGNHYFPVILHIQTSAMLVSIKTKQNKNHKKGCCPLQKQPGICPGFPVRTMEASSRALCVIKIH